MHEQDVWIGHTRLGFRLGRGNAAGPFSKKGWAGRLGRWAGVAGAALAPGSGWAAGAAPRLALPLDCRINQTCFVQNYVDRDPGPGAHDYRCGRRTYQGHNGVDFRIRDMAEEHRGVDVLAAAAGRVLRTRDGVADVSVRVAGPESVRGRECGNGVVIDHGGGWQTQYCHMAQGSIVVHPGETVRSGQPLGHVGLSGDTEFPHVHLSVFRDGVAVDPFAPEGASGAQGAGAPNPATAPAGGCESAHGQSLWSQTPPYLARAVLNAGWAGAPLPDAGAAVEAGAIAPPDPASGYLVAYVRALGLEDGDRMELALSGPGGAVLADGKAPPLHGDRAQDVLYVGKRRPPAGWPKGVYQARYTVRTTAGVVLDRTERFTMP